MIKDSFNSVEIIEMARNIEKEGMEFYRAQAGEAEENDLKGFFLKLARDEDDHYRTFTRLSGEIKDEVKQSADYVYSEEEASAYLRALVESAIFPGEDEPELETLEDAFLYAIRAEKESIIFYQELLEANSGESAEIISKILQEEKQHLVDLVEYMNRFAEN